MMDKNSKIYVAGHTGLVGSAIVRMLKAKGYENVITETRRALDLLNQREVYGFFHREAPDYVFLAAAKVGGILANRDHPFEFIHENLLIESNVISAAAGSAKKLLFLGSSCIYPKDAKNPITEDQLLTGPLEPTNEAYALAKIFGIKLCQALRKQYQHDFISVMPTNLYGPNDNFDPLTSHVIPGLIHKFHKAKIHREPYVKIWGSGQARREFLYVDDLAEALYLVMQTYSEDAPINIGSGEERDHSILSVAHLIKEIVGYPGEIFPDTLYPDGTDRKFLNSDKIKRLGFKPKISLRKGLTLTYDWFLNHHPIDWHPV